MLFCLYGVFGIVATMAWVLTEEHVVTICSFYALDVFLEPCMGFQISQRKTVAEVVIHGEDLEPYLKTSDAGVAHVASLSAPDAASFFRDSPYAWGDKKGSSKTTVLIAGRWKGYDVNTRTCVPPMVCSRMSADVANKAHSQVDFDSPSWLSAMKLCEEDELPARQVEKTTLVRLWRA